MVKWSGITNQTDQKAEEHFIQRYFSVEIDRVLT